MGLLVSSLLHRKVFIINAHDFMAAEHTLIRASGEREKRRPQEN